MTKIIEVKVKPNSRQSKIESNDDGGLVAFVKAQPIDGKANSELISLLASHFGIRRNQVSIKTGSSGRLKRIELDVE